jgi:cyclopropane fatty-acyl-phospholipid synthase-like methyltransferase
MRLDMNMDPRSSLPANDFEESLGSSFFLATQNLPPLPVRQQYWEKKLISDQSSMEEVLADGRAIAAQYDLPDGARMLDLGTGRGELATIFASKGKGRNHEITAVDIVNKGYFFDILEKQDPNASASISYMQQDMSEFAFDKEYDLILAKDALPYIEKEQQKRIILNIAKHLRKGGVAEFNINVSEKASFNLEMRGVSSFNESDFSKLQEMLAKKGVWDESQREGDDVNIFLTRPSNSELSNKS